MDHGPIVVTMGDPGGVGVEIVHKLWLDRKNNPLPPFAVIGTQESFDHYGLSDAVKVINSPDQAKAIFDDFLPLIPVKSSTKTTAGIADPDNAPAVIEAITLAVEFCRTHQAKGMVTMPIQKSSLYKAGFDAPGHTEYLARLCDLSDDDAVMMLANDKLRVVPVTVHLPLKDVPSALTHQMIVGKVMTTATDLRDRFNIDTPRIAVAGLNPHAGEDGMMGLEDGIKIIPALNDIRDMGVTVTGPHPADTLFHTEARAHYDVAVCMYHDQALIPVKTLDFHGSVNVTLGLPIIRTSPDHGTALNIAGQNKARTDSSYNAIKMIEGMTQPTGKPRHA